MVADDWRPAENMEESNGQWANMCGLRTRHTGVTNLS